MSVFKYNYFFISLIAAACQNKDDILIDISPLGKLKMLIYKSSCKGFHVSVTEGKNEANRTSDYDNESSTVI